MKPSAGEPWRPLQLQRPPERTTGKRREVRKGTWSGRKRPDAVGEGGVWARTGPEPGVECSGTAPDPRRQLRPPPPPQAPAAMMTTRERLLRLSLQLAPDNPLPLLLPLLSQLVRPTRRLLVLSHEMSVHGMKGRACPHLRCLLRKLPLDGFSKNPGHPRVGCCHSLSSRLPSSYLPAHAHWRNYLLPLRPILPCRCCCCPLGK